jgi:hypothetical protein
MNFIGELAALATSFFFAITALIFTHTGREVGAQVTNHSGQERNSVELTARFVFESGLMFAEII